MFLKDNISFFVFTFLFLLPLLPWKGESVLVNQVSEDLGSLCSSGLIEIFGEYGMSLLMWHILLHSQTLPSNLCSFLTNHSERDALSGLGV